MEGLNFVLVGAISMASLTAGVFFLRYWRITKDRFFLFFAASFMIEALNRFLLGNLSGEASDTTIFYLVRLLTYGLIIWAIIDKNLPSKGHK